MNVNNHNKCKVIDYLILLKLILLDKNIYFPNIFYKEWVLYLIPHLKKNSDDNYILYYDYCQIDQFIPRYNIKYNLSNIFDKLYNFKDVYISIFFRRKVNFNNISFFTVDINLMQNINFVINNIIQYIIETFIFEIPESMITSLKDVKWTFLKFNDLIIKIWEEYYGVIMYQYIYSSFVEKIIYYQLFKKIFLRIIEDYQKIVE